MKKLFVIFTFLVFGLFLSPQVLAQETGIEDDPQLIAVNEEDVATDYFKGTVIEIVEQKQVEDESGSNTYQKVKVLITRGQFKGQEAIIENDNSFVSQEVIYEVGDDLHLSYSKDQDGNDVFYVTDFDRSWGLSFLFICFVLLTLLIGLKRGALSIFSLIISFVVIFVFTLPQIQNGRDPVLIAILSSLFIIPITFYLSHGFELKTTVAIVGTFISLVITGLLASFFVNLVNLRGIDSEEVMYLQIVGGTIFNLRDLLLAGIIIGTMGIMDDVTVSQTSTVFQLYDLKKEQKFNELFKRSIIIGKDHISSMVNTLVLVYTGSAMPLLLLFMNSPRPLDELISYEMVATEIVRTMVGSIGLILAVPITTALACYAVTKAKKKDFKPSKSGHVH